MTMHSRWLTALGGAAVGAILAGSMLQGDHPPPRPAVPPELTSYRDIVKRVLPGVVSIEARSGKIDPRKAGDDGSLGFGSGFVVDSAGVILTNYHVVEDAAELEVQTAGGHKHLTRDIRFDRASDLAIVRIQAKQPLAALEMGDSDAMEIGDRVLALGAPFGLRGSATQGIVSGKSRSLRLNVFEDFLQTDAAVNPGNSGGPLVNLEGKVIGVTAAIKSRSGGFQGVGLAISSNHARSIVAKLLRDGVVRRGYIGAIVDDLPPDAGPRGVIVRRVIVDSPAARAGLRLGDIITGLGGRPIRDGRDLQQIVNELPLNEAAEADIARGGQQLRLTITIAEHPGPDARK